MIPCLENNLKPHLPAAALRRQHSLLLWAQADSQSQVGRSSGAPLSPVPPASYCQPPGTFSARCNSVHLLPEVSTIRLMWIQLSAPICLSLKVCLGCCSCPKPLSVSFIIPYASKWNNFKQEPEGSFVSLGAGSTASC